MKILHAVAALIVVPLTLAVAFEAPAPRVAVPVECNATADSGKELFSFRAYPPFADQNRRALCLLSSSVSASGLASLGSVWLDEATAGSSPIVVVGESYKCVATPIDGNWASVQSPARVRLEVSALPQ